MYLHKAVTISVLSPAHRQTTDSEQRPTLALMYRTQTDMSRVVPPRLILPFIHKKSL